MGWRQHKRFAKEHMPAIWQIMNEHEKKCKKQFKGFDAGLIGMDMATTIDLLRELKEQLENQIKLNKQTHKIEIEKLKERIKCLELGAF